MCQAIGSSLLMLDLPFHPCQARGRECIHSEGHSDFYTTANSPNSVTNFTQVFADNTWTDPGGSGHSRFCSSQKGMPARNGHRPGPGPGSKCVQPELTL